MDAAIRQDIKVAQPEAGTIEVSLPKLSLAPRISLDEISLVAKTSKLDQKRQQWGCSFSEAVMKLASAGEDVGKMISSHETQEAALKEVLQILPKEQVVPWSEARVAKLARSKAVISLGGDGQFNYVTQWCRDQVVIGMKSDPKSLGAMLRFVPGDMERVVESLARGVYELESWPRAQAKIGDRHMRPATSDYFLGEYSRLLPSTVEIQWNNQSAIVRGSGVVVTTGAGSTGFLLSAGRYLGEFARPFSPSEAKLKFVVSEPMEETFARGVMLYGEIRPGDTFKMRALKASNPVISGDGMGKFKLGGETIEIGFSAHPLNVLRSV
jgi:hypothetical protein